MSSMRKYTYDELTMVPGVLRTSLLSNARQLIFKEDIA
jgi:hypothetical protein